jgi:hypothetical protein
LAQDDGVSLDQPMDRFGSGGKGWSNGNCGRVFQETAGDKTGDRLMGFFTTQPMFLLSLKI